MARRIVIEPSVQPISLGVRSAQAPDVQNDWSRPADTNAALEIAATLAQISPHIEHMAAMDVQAAKEKDLLEAKKEQASMTLEENRALLAALSQKGAVEAGANPWTNIYRSQLAAHRLVSEELSQKADSLLDGVSQSTNSPEDAQKVLVQLHNEYASQIENNPYAQQSFESAFSSLRNEFLQQATALRQKNIISETADHLSATADDIGDIMSKVDLDDIQNQTRINESIISAMDTARLHGVRNANNVVLSALENRISLTATENPSQARQMLEMLGNIKPNGRDPISKTIVGSDLVRSLSIKIDKIELARNASLEKAYKDYTNKIKSNIDDDATMFLEKNPNVRAEDLQSALSAKYGRDNPDIIRKINSIVDIQRNKDTREFNDQQNRVESTIHGLMLTGQYDNASIALVSAIEGGVIEPKRAMALKNEISTSTYIISKLALNPVIMDKFVILGRQDLADPTLNQKLATLSSAVLNEANTRGVSVKDILSDRNTMTSLADSINNTFKKQNAQKPIVNEQDKKEEESWLSKTGDWIKNEANFLISPVYAAAAETGKAVSTVAGWVGLQGVADYLKADAAALDQKFNDATANRPWIDRAYANLGAIPLEIMATGGFGGGLMVQMIKQGSLGFLSNSSVTSCVWNPDTETGQRLLAGVEGAVGGALFHIPAALIPKVKNKLPVLMKNLGGKLLVHESEGAAPAIKEALTETLGTEAAKPAIEAIDNAGRKLIEGNTIPVEILKAKGSLYDRIKGILDYYSKHSVNNEDVSAPLHEFRNWLQVDKMSKNITKTPDVVEVIKNADARAEKAIQDLITFNEKAMANPGKASMKSITDRLTTAQENLTTMAQQHTAQNTPASRKAYRDALIEFNASIKEYDEAKALWSSDGKLLNDLQTKEQIKFANNIMRGE